MYIQNLMDLIHKIDCVDKLFYEVDHHIENFRKISLLKCTDNCGICCTKSNIEATILELLPAAYQLYHERKYEEVFKKLEKESCGYCIFYNPFFKDGYCSIYKNRGLICRLFGFSARENKFGNNIFITCSNIKDQIQHEGLNINIDYAPKLFDYYMKLFGIDPHLSIQYYNINQAFKKALEIIILYFQYRKKPA